jgi:hypothetical protein
MGTAPGTVYRAPRARADAAIPCMVPQSSFEDRSGVQSEVIPDLLGFPGCQLSEQALDAAADLVADGPDLVQGESSGVG